MPGSVAIHKPRNAKLPSGVLTEASSREGSPASDIWAQISATVPKKLNLFGLNKTNFFLQPFESFA
jgi:hypothetical protein